MPTIVACFKWVVDEAYIRATSSGDLDFSSVDHKISDYDCNAIEEAVRLKESLGGSVVAVTASIPGATKAIKDALSRGCDEAYLVADAAFDELEPSQTAAILADVIRSRIEQYDLIICGEGSSDLYAQQVGPRLAAKLGIPCISFVQQISLQDGHLTAERRVDEGVEVLAAPLPAVVTVLPDINVPRIPSVTDTLGALKKPVVTITKDDLQPIGEACLRTISMTAAQMERSCERFGADAAEIGRFAEALRRRGVIR